MLRECQLGYSASGVSPYRMIRIAVQKNEKAAGIRASASSLAPSVTRSASIMRLFAIRLDHIRNRPAFSVKAGFIPCRRVGVVVVVGWGVDVFVHVLPSWGIASDPAMWGPGRHQPLK